MGPAEDAEDDGGPDEDRILAERRLLSDPVAYTLYNPAQVRAIKALEKVNPRGITVIVCPMGNGTGKTHVNFGAIPAALFFGTANPLFAHPVYQGGWPFPKEARFCSNISMLGDTGAIQRVMREQWPAGRWTQRKGMGKPYFSEGRTDTGWTWDVMTYDQDVQQQAGATKGLILCSEPPPEGIFPEMVGRLRGGGVLLIEMTPLTHAGYLADLCEAGWVTNEKGERVAQVVVVKGETHDNCRDHNFGGQLSHEAIEAMVALWPIEEREARSKGTFLSLAGRIYSQWGDANELASFPEYHQAMWDAGRFNLTKVVDPHDRKPYAIGWFATFPNGDVIMVAEWPDQGHPPFHTIHNSPVVDVDAYRRIMLAVEDEGFERRADNDLMDPNFGNSPKAGAMGKTVKQMFSEPCRECESSGVRCSHRIMFQDPPDGIDERHALVRRAIGEAAKGIRPKLYALKDYCPNFCYAMRRYGYEEPKAVQVARKGPPEKPLLKHKDFPDLVGYLYLQGLDEFREPRQYTDKQRRIVTKPRFSRRRAGRETADA